jgi:hypothetical protein
MDGRSPPGVKPAYAFGDEIEIQRAATPPGWRNFRVNLDAFSRKRRAAEWQISPPVALGHQPIGTLHSGADANRTHRSIGREPNGRSGILGSNF